MIKYTDETFAELKDDFGALIEEHWEEVARNQHDIKLNPDYDQYYNLEANGNLHCIAVRDDGDLIGYAISIIGRSLHYKDHLFAINDAIYIHPEYRRGRVGYTLVKEMIKHYKAKSVSLNRPPPAGIGFC